MHILEHSKSSSSSSSKQNGSDQRVKAGEIFKDPCHTWITETMLSPEEKIIVDELQGWIVKRLLRKNAEKMKKCFRGNFQDLNLYIKNCFKTGNF